MGDKTSDKLKKCYDWVCLDQDAVQDIPNNQDDNWNSQDEREFEDAQIKKIRTANFLMLCPCLCPLGGMCLGGFMYGSAMCNPPDARKLSDDEAKPFIDGLQGGWKNLFLKIVDQIS